VIRVERSTPWTSRKSERRPNSSEVIMPLSPGKRGGGGDYARRKQRNRRK